MLVLKCCVGDKYCAKVQSQQAGAALLEELIYKSLTEKTYVLFTIMSFSFPQR